MNAAYGNGKYALFVKGHCVYRHQTVRAVVIEQVFIRAHFKSARTGFYIGNQLMDIFLLLLISMRDKALLKFFKK